MPVDLDSLDYPLNTFESVMRERLRKYNAIAYPTISQGLKSGLRYRVVFAMDRKITSPEDFALLVDVFTFMIVRKWLRVDEYKQDASNGGYSQLQGLAVRTTRNRDAPIIESHGKDWDTHTMMKVAEMLDFKQWRNRSHIRHYASRNIPHGQERDTIKYITALATGNDADCFQGNRNEYMMHMLFTLRNSCGNDADLWFEVLSKVELFNQLQSAPLSHKELNSIIRSAEKSIKPTKEPYSFLVDCLKLLKGEELEDLRAYYCALFNQANGNNDIVEYWDRMITSKEKEEMKAYAYRRYKANKYKRSGK